MEPVEIMRSLINHLPKSDVLLASSFIDLRDFESLQDLVNSAIIKVRRNLNSESPKEEYLSLDMNELMVLKAVVDVYVEQLSISSNEEYDTEDYTDEEEY